MSDFQGFDSPGTTATPDYVFDFLLKELTGNELKALMYIIRRTFGFGKSADAISLSQFREGIKTKDGKVLNVGCGIGHNRLILAALAGLEKKGYVVSQKREATDGSKETTIYKLRFKKAEQVVTPSNEVVTSGNQGGSYFSPQGVVTSGNQQETHVEQETLRESVIVTNTETQSEITPTLPDVAPDYTTTPTIELSTASSQNVDNSQRENGSQSYSHRPDTSPATHVGVMPVLSVPMPPGVKMPDAPQAPPKVVRQQQPPAPTEIYTQGARDIRKLYDSVHGIATGHPEWEWKKMEDMAASGVVPTREDMQLVYDHLKKASKKHTIAHVWEAWGELPALKKPVATPGQSSSDGEIGVSGRRRFRAPEGFGEPRKVVGGAK